MSRSEPTVNVNLAMDSLLGFPASLSPGRADGPKRGGCPVRLMGHARGRGVRRTTGLEQQFPGGTCWQAAELMPAVRAALDAHGFDYWNVEDRTHAGTPCASASVIDFAHLSYQVVDESRPGHV